MDLGFTISRRLHNNFTPIPHRFQNDIRSFSQRLRITLRRTVIDFRTRSHQFHNDSNTTSHQCHIELTSLSQRFHVALATFSHHLHHCFTFLGQCIIFARVFFFFFGARTPRFTFPMCLNFVQEATGSDGGAVANEDHPATA